ncbi:CHAT domain-containing protein [Laspinema olomoucense]|uniref:CHAT domain-containing protein n=1 Tax=Laspinema olomoucense TaxID=3231600 RepID=UPI0021BA459C|nr:CHAT domain-containing tetratricopeptide repeat protein [Laspinema sp. D3d]MCT7971850.1 CHAT domain-containing tetratricopeptide repeat protein [Laspinema sp. D3d]
MRLKNISSCLLLVGFILLNDETQFIKFPSRQLGLLPVLAQTGEESLAQEARRLYELGYEQTDRGEFQEALATFDRALTMALQVGDRRLEGVILNDIAVVYRILGDYPQALQFLNQAFTLRQQINDRSGIAQTLVNFGAVYQSLADYPQALDFYQQALPIVQGEQEQDGEAVILTNMGELYRQLGQPNKALASFQNALSLFEKEGDQWAIGIALANIGAAYDALGELSQSLEFYQKSLAIATEVQDTLGIGQTWINIGAIYEKLADYPQAIQAYQQGLAVMRELGDLDSIGQAFNNLGSVHRRMGEYSQALEFYERALEIRENIGNRAGMAVTLQNKGLALFEAGKLPEATETLYAGIDVLESLRPGLSDLNKVSIFDKYQSTYSILQKALIAQNQPEKALTVAERGRARAFVELIAKRLSPEAAQEFSDRQIPPPTIQDIQQVAAEQNATLVEYSIVVDNSAKNSSLLIWVVKPTGAIAFREVDLSLLEGFRDNLVQFLVGEETDAQPEPLLTALVRGSRSSITETLPTISPGQVSNRKLKKLHELLINPIADLLPTNPEEKVIFIPHKELFFVPFPALIDESDRYLIEKHTILTAPGIQLLQIARIAKRDGPRETAGALVVGNPVMPIFQRNPGEEPEGLKNLPGAEQEATAIAAMLNTQPLIGSEATETAVVERITSAGIVHLATHGLLDDFSESGLLGAIALAPSDRDDGLLTSEEIIGLELNADLVVLSACSTGGGSITGDGIIGLSRAVIGAGAESVIVSLWQADDQATAQLMEEFYRVLPQTGDRAVALRQAMLATLPDYPNVRDWGAFMLIGESASQ